MEFFIKVYFWIALISIVLRFINLGYTDYPRKIERGTDAIGLMLSIPFVIWALYLIWI